MNTIRQLTIAACGVSAVVHLALVPGHTSGSPALAAGFMTAGVALLALAGALHARVAPRATPAATAILLGALIAAYFVDRASGPGAVSSHAAQHGDDDVDALGLATKTVEAIGLFASVALASRRESVTKRIRREA